MEAEHGNMSLRDDTKWYDGSAVRDQRIYQTSVAYYACFKIVCPTLCGGLFAPPAYTVICFSKLFLTKWEAGLFVRPRSRKEVRREIEECEDVRISRTHNGDDYTSYTLKKRKLGKRVEPYSTQFGAGMCRKNIFRKIWPGINGPGKKGPGRNGPGNNGPK